MSNGLKEGLRDSAGRLFNGRPVFGWIRRYAALEIAVLLALGIAAYFVGRHLFDTTVPGEGDVRAHIFKIEFLQSYLSQFSWPQWNPYWYHGIPQDQYYPPGFYFLSALTMYATGSSVIAYKVWLFLAFVLNGLSLFYFARRFLGFGAHAAMWCMAAYITSTPLLVNFMYGEGPNLLGWSVTIFFLTVYFSQIMEKKTSGLFYILWPGFLLGAAILIHPFPVLFAGVMIAVFHLVWLAHNWRRWKEFLRSQAPYIAGVGVTGALLGAYYWVPAMLTLDYSSPIYGFTKYMWQGGTLYLLAIVFLALAVSAITRFKVRHDVRLDAMIVTFCLACALGFGGVLYLPFGLGSLVQEFRYATIILPFLGILLIAMPWRYRLAQVSLGKAAAGLAVGAFLTAFVFGLNQRESFAAGFSALKEISLKNLYELAAVRFGDSFPAFAVAMLPYFAVIVILALALRRKPLETGGSRHLFVLAGGVCLLLVTSFVPYINTDKSVALGRLYKYVDNYEQPGYAQIMSAANEGRMIVPMVKGFLVEGDTPVTFAWRWGVETVNGPYNQGDPKFFKMSVHLEWSERWLNYSWTRENLMLESAAKYIFLRDNFGMPTDLAGMATVVNNKYGKLLEIKQNVAYANRVTPVLMDVSKPREAMEFFNILMPQGYRMVLVDVKDVPPGMMERFEYVMVDDASQAAGYPGKTVFVLKEADDPEVREEQGMVMVNVPYLRYTNQLFYHGDIANGYMWNGWDAWPGARINASMKAVLLKAGVSMTNYVNKLDYTPVSFTRVNDNRIKLGNSAGFTLVKESYFPYWESPGDEVISTSQGFMLVCSGDGESELVYRKPLYYIMAAALTGVGLAGAVTALVVLTVKRRREE